MSNRYTIRITIEYDPTAALWCAFCRHAYHCQVNAGLYEDDVRIDAVCPRCYENMKSDFDNFRSALKQRAKKMRRAGLRHDAKQLTYIYRQMLVPPAIEDGVMIGEGFSL